MTQLARGWYQDPDSQGSDRYFDGKRWTQLSRASSVKNPPLLLVEGWYADPRGRYAERYFNGTSWTDETRGAESAAATSLAVDEAVYELRWIKRGVLAIFILLLGMGLIVFGQGLQ